VEQLVELHDLDVPCLVHHQEVDVPCKVHQNLSTGAAWWRVLWVIGDDRDCFEIAISLRDRLEDRRALCTNGKGKRADLDIAAGIDTSV
jgi:hypothetical protein